MCRHRWVDLQQTVGARTCANCAIIEYNRMNQYGPHQYRPGSGKGCISTSGLSREEWERVVSSSNPCRASRRRPFRPSSCSCAPCLVPVNCLMLLRLEGAWSQHGKVMEQSGLEHVALLKARPDLVPFLSGVRPNSWCWHSLGLVLCDLIELPDHLRRPPGVQRETRRACNHSQNHRFANGLERFVGHRSLRWCVLC